MENSEERKSKFSASRISELLAGGSGKTRDNYIYDLAKESLGLRKEIDTSAMKHGTANQINAFEFVLKPLFPDARWLDTFIPINDLCGASPDLMIDDVTPADVKCPFYIDTYIEQINKVPTKYYQQVQMQMMATGGDVGILCFYLTKPMEWGEETVVEYPFPLEDRYRIFEFKKEEELQDRILKAVEAAEPKKQLLITMLKSAIFMDEIEFFYYQMKGNKLRKLKEASNMYNVTKIYRVNDEFYYEIK
jgi:hypothetical protein